MKKRNAVALVALPALLLIAYGVERWRYTLRQTAVRTFEFNSWQFTSGILIYTFLTVGLVWWMSAFNKPHPIVSIIYLLAGRLLAFHRPLSLTLNLVSHDPALASGWAITQTGAIFLTTGLLSLIKPRKPDELEA